MYPGGYGCDQSLGQFYSHFCNTEYIHGNQSSRPSLEKFENTVVPGGKLFINSSIVDTTSSRTDIDIYYVPCNEIAHELGIDKVSNMVMLGAYLEKCPIVQIDSVLQALLDKLGKNKAHLIPMNREAFAKGAEVVK